MTVILYFIVIRVTHLDIDLYISAVGEIPKMKIFVFSQKAKQCLYSDKSPVSCCCIFKSPKANQRARFFPNLIFLLHMESKGNSHNTAVRLEKVKTLSSTLKKTQRPLWRQ